MVHVVEAGFLSIKSTLRTTAICCRYIFRVDRTISPIFRFYPIAFPFWGLGLWPIFRGW